MLNKAQLEAVVTEARSHKRTGLSAVERYRLRKTIIEVLAFIPLFRPILRPFIEAWWLETICMWDHMLSEKTKSDALELVLEKNRVYGSRQLYRMGTLGIFIRSVDKIERIVNIDGGVSGGLVETESKHDSLMDLFNYSILSVLLLRKEV